MDITPTESSRNTYIAPLRASLDSTSTELLASPIYVGSLSLLLPLFIYLKRTMRHNLFIFGRKRDPKLLRVEEVILLEKHINTFDLGFLIYIFSFLHFY